MRELSPDRGATPRSRRGLLLLSGLVVMLALAVATVRTVGTHGPTLRPTFTPVSWTSAPPELADRTQARNYAWISEAGDGIEVYRVMTAPPVVWFRRGDAWFSIPGSGNAWIGSPSERFVVIDPHEGWFELYRSTDGGRTVERSRVPTVSGIPSEVALSDGTLRVDYVTAEEPGDGAWDWPWERLLHRPREPGEWAFSSVDGGKSWQARAPPHGPSWLVTTFRRLFRPSGPLPRGTAVE